MKTYISIVVFIYLPTMLFLQAVSGEERVCWTTSRIVGTPDPPKPYHVRRTYPNLKFSNPVEIAALGSSGKMAVLEVSGRLLTFNDSQECVRATVALELQPTTEHFVAAYSFAVHPNFDANRKIFLVYSSHFAGKPDGTRLSRFTMTMEGEPKIDIKSEELILTWPSGGHNGSAIRFDPEGLLYFSAGDGSKAFPPDTYGVAQDLSDLRSTICRIDVDRPAGNRLYSVPQDNPFVSTPQARPEIWAYGLRNPWRFSFVPGTKNQILCGDVGWDLWEMVYDVRRGGNYGWSIFEGPRPNRGDIEQGPTPIQKPLKSYPHTVGQSITGGQIYHSRKLPELDGVYLYGDYVTGLLWGLKFDESGVTWQRLLAETGLPIITFGETRSGEPLVVSYDGLIYELVRNDIEGRSNNKFPRRLSETGLFKNTQTLDLAPGVYQYEPMAQSWQNGARSHYVIGVPGNEAIKVSKKQVDWEFPKGTVFARTFLWGETESRRVETQLLHFDGLMWHPYSYVWNDAETDATLVGSSGLVKNFPKAGKAAEYETFSWKIQHRAQCQTCHTRQRGGGISFELENLVGTSQDGLRSHLERFVELGIFNQNPEQWKNKSMVDPYDESQTLERRARSYLSANCVHCHQRGGSGIGALDVRYFRSLKTTNTVNFEPTQGTFGIHDAKVISPGDPYRSVLFFRMATSGPGHMPKLWSRDNDLKGLQLLHDWIKSLPKSDQHTERERSDTESALAEFASLAFGGVSDSQRQIAARDAVNNGDPLRSALFERFLPAEERKKRLGDDINPAEILAVQGHINNGRDLVMKNRAQQCLQCHRILGAGKSCGPDLDGIGAKYSSAKLLESILEPSKDITPQFQSHLVLTNDGETVSGLLVRREKDSIVLRLADGRERTFSNDSIDSAKISSVSLMPQGLISSLTAQEAADMLAFLKSLK